DRLEVLAHDRFLEGCGCAHINTPGLNAGLTGCPYSVSILRDAQNAHCGISTRPTRFIRFLPSFCFSSSLRLREMSPPYDLDNTFLRMARTESRVMTRLAMVD